MYARMMGSGSASEMACISSRIAIPCHISVSHHISNGGPRLPATQQ